MAGIQLRIDIDGMEHAENVFQNLERAPGNMFPVWDEIGFLLAQSAQDNIRNSVSPDGTPLEHLADATKHAPGRGGDSAIPLLDHANLLDSYTHIADNEGVDVGSNAIQAALMHFGGPAGRNHSVTIPPREVLGVSENDADDIIDIASDYLSGEMQ